MNSGIYEIKNGINSNIYIGSSVNLKARLYFHRHALETNSHYNKHLQSAWNKYGKENFYFYVIEYCHKNVLVQREQYFIDTFNPIYNKCQKAYSCAGVIKSKETCQKISKAKMGHPVLPETRARLSLLSTGNNNALGYKHTKEAKIKMSLSHKGIPMPYEKRMNISKALIGIRRSEETKKKMSLASTGNKYALGHKQTDMTRANMSLAQFNRTPEHQAKITASLKAYWNNRKAQED